MLKNILIVILIMANVTLACGYRDLQKHSVQWMTMYFDEAEKTVDLECEIDNLNALYD